MGLGITFHISALREQGSAKRVLASVNRGARAGKDHPPCGPAGFEKHLELIV
jgi:hypothetical protein